MKKKSFIILMLLPLLAACSSDAIEELTVQTPEAKVASGTEPVDIMATFSDFTDANGGTTGTRSHATNNTFESGDQLWVGRGTNSSSNKAKLYKHNGTKFTSTDPLYWQQMTENLYGYWRGDDASGVLTADFRLQRDQSTLQGLKKSDFIYASNKDCTYPVTSNNAQLANFVHRVAKIQVTVKNTSSMTFQTSKLQNAYVGNTNLYLQAGVDVEGNLYPKLSGDTGTVKMYQQGATFSAFIIPQSVNYAVSFISFTYDNKVYRMLLNRKVNFEAGYVYTFELGVDNTGSDGLIFGTPNVIPLINATANSVGYVVSSDGYAYKSGEILRKQGKTAIGVIGRVTTVCNGSNVAQGDIVALTDAGKVQFDNQTVAILEWVVNQPALSYNGTSTKDWTARDKTTWEAILRNFGGPGWSGLSAKIEEQGGKALSDVTHYWSTTTHSTSWGDGRACWNFDSTQWYDDPWSGPGQSYNYYFVRAVLSF